MFKYVVQSDKHTKSVQSVFPQRILNQKCLTLRRESIEKPNTFCTKVDFIGFIYFHYIFKLLHNIIYFIIITNK